MASSVLLFSLLVISLYGADGFEFYTVNRCVFNSTEVKDIDYILSYYYNQVEQVRFSSSVGKYVGYTEWGLKQAEYWNNDSAEIRYRQQRKYSYCKRNVDGDYQAVLSKTVTPSVRLRSVTPHGGGEHTAKLMCSAYDFYPKRIDVTWLRDGQEVTSDVSSTEAMDDGDWYYQFHSYLEYTPRSGEKISCMVEHPDLMEPVIKDWDPSMPESERNKMTIGASGLTLGLILPLAGFIFYRRRKAQGRDLVPTN